MTTFVTAGAARNTPSNERIDQRPDVAGTTGSLAREKDAKELLSVFCPFLGILALAAIGIVTISGQFPWFVLPLGVFVFFASCLPWRRFP